MSKYDDALQYLHNSKPGWQPLEIFREIARITVLPIYEIVLFHIDPVSREVKVLLVQRPADDTWWPNSWHVPGTVMLSTDEFASGNDFHAPLDRIIKDEIQGTISLVSEPKLLLTERRKSKRGHELAMIYWVEVHGEPKNGKYYGLNELPSDMLEHQIRLIEAAMIEFRQN
jgi:hypothetical protein